VKLSDEHASRCPEETLRHFAKETLGAKRISAAYLRALRFVLGNQAHADRIGCDLEMNVGVRFIAPQTMRTLIAQFFQAGITSKRRRRTMGGLSAVVTYYRGDSSEPITVAEDSSDLIDPGDEYARIQREHDERDDHPMIRWSSPETSGVTPADLTH
jgi:hypothetical protein